MVLRVLLGIGEAVCNPVAYSLIADLFSLSKSVSWDVSSIPPLLPRLVAFEPFSPAATAAVNTCLPPPPLFILQAGFSIVGVPHGCLCWRRTWLRGWSVKKRGETKGAEEVFVV